MFLVFRASDKMDVIDKSQNGSETVLYPWVVRGMKEGGPFSE
jgi:hypothetical protein